MNPDRLAEADARWSTVLEMLREESAVQQQNKKGFSNGGLMAKGKLFANLRKDELLLKLSWPKVAALIASGDGSPFDAGRGKPMKEWVRVKLEAAESWRHLAREAMNFVSRSTID